MENGQLPKNLTRDYLFKLVFLLLLIGILASFSYFTFFEGTGGGAPVSFYRVYSSHQGKKILEIGRDDLERVTISRRPAEKDMVHRICFHLATDEAREKAEEIHKDFGYYEMQVGRDLRDRYRLYGTRTRLAGGAFCVSGRFRYPAVKRFLGSFIDREIVPDEDDISLRDCLRQENRGKNLTGKCRELARRMVFFKEDCPLRGEPRDDSAELVRIGRRGIALRKNGTGKEGWIRIEYRASERDYTGWVRRDCLTGKEDERR